VITKLLKAKERVITLTTKLQSERDKWSVLAHKHQAIVLEQQQHNQQLEAMETSCRAVTAEGLKQQTLASSNHSQERLQLTTSLEAQVALARQQHDHLTKLQEQVSFVFLNNCGMTKVKLRTIRLVFRYLDWSARRQKSQQQRPLSDSDVTVLWIQTPLQVYSFACWLSS